MADLENDLGASNEGTQCHRRSHRYTLFYLLRFPKSGREIISQSGYVSDGGLICGLNKNGYFVRGQGKAARAEWEKIFPGISGTEMIARVVCNETQNLRVHGRDTPSTVFQIYDEVYYGENIIKIKYYRENIFVVDEVY